MHEILGKMAVLARCPWLCSELVNSVVWVSMAGELGLGVAGGQVADDVFVLNP